MGKVTLSNLVSNRQYTELEERAGDYIERDDWKGFLKIIQQASSKTRDAVVNLLELEAVGGTDSDIFKEFSSLEGTTLQQIRNAARDHAVNVVKEQIENRHTFFLDVDAMAASPFAVLVKDVIEARNKELTQLEGIPSRIDVLGTFYGFTILMIDGTEPLDTSSAQSYRYRRRRTWLGENISQNAVNAVKQLTGQFGEAVDMDASYETLGSSRVFKSRCSKTTANILADAVRLSMYKVPGNRSSAAKNLGSTEDSRVLPFLHHRFPIEENRTVRISIAESLGKVGHESSIDVLKESANLRGRYLTKVSLATVDAIGGIYSLRVKATLTDILRDSGNAVKAHVIQAISKQETSGLMEIIIPFLKHKSRPVVRASVQALFNLGNEGETVIRDQSHTIIRKVLADGSSKHFLRKIFMIEGISESELIHQFFAERIKRYGNVVKKFLKEPEARYSSWYYKQRINRARSKLLDCIRQSVSYLKPPYLNSLIINIQDVLNTTDMSNNVTGILGRGELAIALAEKIIEKVPEGQMTLQEFL